MTGDNAAVVAEICIRLDGLPLAIELAAARIKLFPAIALLTRLDQRLKHLTGGARDLPVRQQTLRGAIDWSYDLLDSAEQQFFRRLGVFVGGVTLEAAEAVCNAEGNLEVEVLDALQSLLDKSLVQQELVGPDGMPRLRMLATIREYALERLETSGESQVLHRHHAAYFLGLAEEAEQGLRSRSWTVWRGRLDVEYDNLRAALLWSQSSAGDPELGLRLVGALWLFWLRQGSFGEWDRWLTSALERAHAATAAARAKALLGGAFLAYTVNHEARAAALGVESLALYQTLGDRWGIAASLMFASIGDALSGAVAQAKAGCEAGVALAREVGDPWLLAWMLVDYRNMFVRPDMPARETLLQEALRYADEVGETSLSRYVASLVGYWALTQGDHRQAVAHFEQSLVFARTVDNKLLAAHALLGLGWAAWDRGDYAAMRVFNDERRVLEQELGNTLGVSHALVDLGRAAWAQGDHPQAVAHFQESLALARETGSLFNIAHALYGLGCLVRTEGDAGRAAELFKESLSVARRMRVQDMVVQVLSELGHVTLASDAQDEASAHFRECLALAVEINHTPSIATGIDGLAEVAAASGTSARAARLFGAGHALRERFGYVLPPPLRLERDRAIRTAAAQLDEATWNATWAEGRVMTLEQAIAYALE